MDDPRPEPCEGGCGCRLMMVDGRARETAPLGDPAFVVLAEHTGERCRSFRMLRESAEQQMRTWRACPDDLVVQLGFVDRDRLAVQAAIPAGRTAAVTERVEVIIARPRVFATQAADLLARRLFHGPPPVLPQPPFSVFAADPHAGARRG